MVVVNLLNSVALLKKLTLYITVKGGVSLSSWCLSASFGITLSFMAILIMAPTCTLRSALSFRDRLKLNVRESSTQAR